MIHFFRRIRQGLLSQNRFSKYLIYAIGEIILVVLGILIALQVNNWNELKKNQNEIKKSAKSLIIDLEKDLAAMSIIISQTEVTQKRLDSLISYLQIKDIRQISNLEMYCLSWNFMYRPYSWHRSTIESLINSNGLENIKNDSLSQKIIEYYSYTQHLDKDYNEDLNISEGVNNHRSMLINKNYKNREGLSKALRTFNNQSGFSGVKPFTFYASQSYQKAIKENLLPLSKDSTQIKIFVNNILDIKGNLSIRLEIEWPKLKTQANELILLLKANYD